MHGEPTVATPTERVARKRQQELELLLRNAPADANAYLELAQIYRDQQRHFDAMRVLERAIQHLPDEQKLRWEFEEAQLARALQRLNTARQIAIQSPKPEHDVDLERARTEWAVRRAEVCRGRLSRQPGQAKLHIVLAEALRDLGQFEEALREAEAATMGEDDAPAAHWVRGQCLAAIGRPLDALSAWRSAALRRSVPAPESIRLAALRAAVNLALHHGLYASAQRYLEELANIRPDDAAIRETLVKVRSMTTHDDAELVAPIDLNLEG